MKLGQDYATPTHILPKLQIVIEMTGRSSVRWFWMYAVALSTTWQHHMPLQTKCVRDCRALRLSDGMPSLISINPNYTPAHVYEH